MLRIVLQMKILQSGSAKVAGQLCFPDHFYIYRKTISTEGAVFLQDGAYMENFAIFLGVNKPKNILR